mgnify:CR=1 FL=1
MRYSSLVFLCTILSSSLAFAADSINVARGVPITINYAINDNPDLIPPINADPQAMVDAIDPALVGEVHLAGHAREEHPDGALLIDDHGSAVTGETWQLFERFVERAGPCPVLIEWDTNVPEFDVLLTEAGVADAILRRATRGRESIRASLHAVA